MGSQYRMDSMLQKPRLLHIEIIRILAAFSVIFNHTGSEGFTLFMKYDAGTLRYWLYLLFSVLCKIGVPLFFMISGALLLRTENEPFRKQRNRFLRILAVLFLFSVLAYVQQLLLGNEVFRIGRFFRVFFTSSWMAPYWFLYAYLGFLLTLPFLRKLAQNLSGREYRYLLTLVFVLTGALPVLLRILFLQETQLNGNFSIEWIAALVVFYPLLGYYLENRLEEERINGRKLLLLWGSSVLCIAATCFATCRDNLLQGQFTQKYLMSLLLVPVAAIYLTLQYQSRRRQDKKKAAPQDAVPADSPGIKILLTVSSCTFGIYLFHGLFLGFPDVSLLHLLLPDRSAAPLCFALLRCLELFLYSGLLTWILRQIPGVKKLL